VRVQVLTARSVASVWVLVLVLVWVREWERA
jgi:hypothetical protein